MFPFRPFFSYTVLYYSLPSLQHCGINFNILFQKKPFMVIVKVILICCRKFGNMSSKSTTEEEPLVILYFLSKIFINKPKINLLMSCFIC